MNNSDERVVFYEQYRSQTDTNISTLPIPLTASNTADRTITIGNYIEIPGPFKSIFRESPDELLMIFLFSKDTIEQVPCEEIVERNLVLRRYDLTEEDLDSLDWRIEYP